MNAHKFVAEHGIDEAKRVLSKVKPNCKIYDLTSNKYHESRVITIPVGCSMYPAYKVIEVKEFVDLSELKQVVESVEIVERSGGFESVKAAITNYRASGDKVTFSSLEKRLADYELVESYKQVKCEVLDMVDVSPSCEVRNG